MDFWFKRKNYHFLCQATTSRGAGLTVTKFFPTVAFLSVKNVNFILLKTGDEVKTSVCLNSQKDTKKKYMACKNYKSGLLRFNYFDRIQIEDLFNKNNNWKKVWNFIF